MSRLYSYLNSAKEVLEEYKAEEPFAFFLKKFFRQNKKYGSKDRKQIGHLCYCYFRLGKALPELPVDERILIGLFLCSTAPNEIIVQFKPEWNDKVKSPVYEKFLFLNFQDSLRDVFPWNEQLSEEINHEKLCESFFIQPDLFLRLRPRFEDIVKERLSKANIPSNEIDASCLALPNNSKIEQIIELDKEAVVQDYNSQQIGTYLKSAIANLIPMLIGTKISAWDCCAASGGKSLLLYDINSNIELTVSDIRESILTNLKKRFSNGGIKKYKWFIADLTSNEQLVTSSYDLIICDAPCTGSGTWSRTPEQLYFFEEKKIEQYASLQKKIVSNIIPHLNENGFLVYITCSVFKKENGEVVNYLKQTFNIELVNTELLKGYDRKADTMFVALFRKL